MNITYRAATADDLETITRLAVLLHCGDYSEKCEYDELYGFYKGDLTNCGARYIICYAENKPAGFAHIALRRDYVEGTSGGTIGYLEGVFVRPEYRRRGVARTLTALGEQWAREQGCREFASDCILGNDDSVAFHTKIGFEIAERIVCFVKKL